MQEQIPADNECKQQRPDCHDVVLLAVKVSETLLRIAALANFACHGAPIAGLSSQLRAKHTH